MGGEGQGLLEEEDTKSEGEDWWLMTWKMVLGEEMKREKRMPRGADDGEEYLHAPHPTNL